MKKRILNFLGIWLGKPLLSFLFGLSRQIVVNEDALKKALEGNRSVIISCWHGRLLFPLYFLRNRNCYGLAGLHEDAEIVARVGAKIGWKMIRGSSTRGGREAYNTMVSLLENMGNIFGVTPDGPRGPKHRVKPGTVRAAMRTGAVIIPVSGQATRKMEIKNWDTFVVPKPFGKTVFIFGEPLEFKENDNFDSAVKLLEDRLNKVEKEADAFFIDKA